MDREQIAANVDLFDNFLTGGFDQREFHRAVIKNGKKFLALIRRDRVVFIPGHYAVAPLSQLEQLHQKQTVSATAVARPLAIVCGSPLETGEPLYEEIDALYVNYCAQSGDQPSAHHQARTYWLMRPS